MAFLVSGSWEANKKRLRIIIIIICRLACDAANYKVEDSRSYIASSPLLFLGLQCIEVLLFVSRFFPLTVESIKQVKKTNLFLFLSLSISCHILPQTSPFLLIIFILLISPQEPLSCGYHCRLDEVLKHRSPFWCEKEGVQSCLW